MKIGVIVGRFQTHYLHAGHRQVIDTALSENDHVIIFLVESLVYSRSNPLPVIAREKMIRGAYPCGSDRMAFATIHDVHDIPKWNDELDNEIQRRAQKDDIVTLYGSRSSFVDTYEGPYQIKLIEAKTPLNATKFREDAARTEMISGDRKWMRGAIWGMYNQRPPLCIPRIYVALRTADKTQFAMFQSPRDAQKYQFLSCNVKPTDTSLEDLADTLVHEEIHHHVTDVKYIGSALIQDEKYFGSVDQVMALFFVCDVCDLTESFFGDVMIEILSLSLEQIKDYVIPNQYCLADMLIKEETI